MLGGRRFYAAIAGIYAITRLALYGLGVRFSVAYDWQHVHDLDLLRDRLAETLFYTHALTPFINAVIGVTFKISETHAPAIYQGLFFMFGLGFVLSMAYLLRALGLGPRLAAAAVTLFCCSPPFIYLESFFHYEFPTAALVTLAAALFHRALATGRWPFWLLFFADCALVAFVRTTFHLVWVLAALGLALLFQRAGRRALLGASLGPIAALLALYLKNLVLFGFFGMSSWIGFNLSMLTVRRMGDAERDAWVAQGKIHPASAVSLYSGPRAYAAYVDLSKTRGVPVLDRIDRAVGAPNWNHWSYLEISKIRMADARYFVTQYPGRYADEVLANAVDFFRPTTRWHPFDRTRSPHRPNRRVLGRWENLYNRALHGGRLEPFRLYLPLLALFAYGTGTALAALRGRRRKRRLAEKTVVFMAFCSLYVFALSCLVTTNELSRYRFSVEAFLWVISFWTLHRALGRARAAGTSTSPAAPSSPEPELEPATEPESEPKPAAEPATGPAADTTTNGAAGEHARA